MVYDVVNNATELSHLEMRSERITTSGRYNHLTRNTFKREKPPSGSCRITISSGEDANYRTRLSVLEL
jgi:hypothetical protein